MGRHGKKLTVAFVPPGAPVFRRGYGVHVLPSVDRALEVPRGLEDRYVVVRYLDRFPGPGGAARAGLAVSHLEGAESPELDSVAPRERFLRGGQKGVHLVRSSTDHHQ